MSRSVIVGMVALLVLARLGTALAADFPGALNGVWAGTYCGKNSTQWVFVMDRSAAFARERWCNGFSCGDVNYRITRLSKSQRRLEVLAYSGRNYSLTGYTIVLDLRGDRELRGTYYGHPRCQTVQLTKQSEDNVGYKPLSANTPKPLPESTSIADEAPPQPSRPQRSTSFCQDVYNSCMDNCGGIHSSNEERNACFQSCYDNRKYCR